MRFVFTALQDRGVPLDSIYLSLERNMKCAVGHCGHCQLGHRFVCKDGPVFAGRPDRDAARGEGAVSDERRSSRSGSSPPATAASSRCSTSSASWSRCPTQIEVAYFLEATRGEVEGPYDLSLVEGSITTPHDVERIKEVRAKSRRLVTIGACATSGGIQALRNFADVEDFISVVYATPEYISTLETSTPISANVHVDFELQGCPVEPPPAAGGDQRLRQRAQARDRQPQRLHRVQAGGQRLRDGRARHALPRAGDARRLRRALPEL